MIKKFKIPVFKWFLLKTSVSFKISQIRGLSRFSGFLATLHNKTIIVFMQRVNCIKSKFSKLMIIIKQNTVFLPANISRRCIQACKTIFIG